MPPKKAKKKEPRSSANTGATTEDNSPKKGKKARKQEKSGDVTLEGSGKEKKKKRAATQTKTTTSDEKPDKKPEADFPKVDKTVKSERTPTTYPLAEAFCERVLNRKDPVVQLVKEFRTEKRSTDLTKMLEFQKHAEKNRYKDVGCLDNNRVELTFGPSTYIHANFVGFEKDPKKYICTQGPLPNTIEDFWSMVWQEGCRCIIMLCNYLEKNAKKCAEYLPKSVSQPMEFGEMRISVLRKGPYPFVQKTSTKVVKTELEVAVGEKRLAVVHLHWLDWPDRGVPPADNAPIEVVNELQLYRDNPVVVHCSAGIGRTGSLVLLDMLMDQYNNRVPWKPDLCAEMVEVRKQRNNSVQTEQQYLYVHQVVFNFLRAEKVLPPEMMKLHDIFTAEYEKACKGF